MISAGVEGRLSYMTYPEPWRGPPKPPIEFLRPAPKPGPAISRYNGMNTTTPNGTRIAPPARPISKYAHTVTTIAPVNLTQQKDDVPEEIQPFHPYSIYSTNYPYFSHYPMHPPQFAHIIRAAYPPSIPISPSEAYSPTTPTASTSTTFLPPPAAFSPPTSAVKTGQSILKDKRTPPIQPQSSVSTPSQVSFKVPSKEVSLKGKEGSLKHRILTRPEENIRCSGPLDLQQKIPSQNVTAPRKRLSATITSPSPPRSPQKLPPAVGNLLASFSKGSLIQLATGDLRKIEDMRTEDFVLSAQSSPDLRLADSTVVKIDEDHRTGKATITLSYNQRRAQGNTASSFFSGYNPVSSEKMEIDLESSAEHPYFVYGQGWASCNPEKTLQCHGLNVHRLQVGDVLITVTPREPALPSTSSRTPTIMTTATTTAMSVRQAPPNSVSRTVSVQPVSQVQQVQVVQSLHTQPVQVVQQIQPVQVQPMNLHTSSANSSKQENNHNAAKPRDEPPLSPDSLAARKRRWSAPDQISAQEEQARRIKME